MDIAWGLLQFHRQDNHAQQGGWGKGDNPTKVSCTWQVVLEAGQARLRYGHVRGGTFEDCWARYMRMTALAEAEGITDELRECFSKQLNTHLVHMHGRELCDPVMRTSC